MKTIVITGGTGLVGKALTNFIQTKGYKVIILSRNPQHQKIMSPNLRFAFWDIEKKIIDKDALLQADHIIHLAGAGVMDKKWTPTYKEEIVNSRMKSSELIVETLKKNPHHVASIVSSSAIGWYGPDSQPNYSFSESDPAANDFLGNTCQLWESSITAAEMLGIRVCKLRTGIVLSNEGGALPEFKKSFKWGIAGILGSGKQIISWIHIDDLCKMFLYAIENNQMYGSFNATAPNPINNKTLNYKLGHFLNHDKFIPMYVPSFLLKMMMGERSIEVLKSTRVDATKVLQTGFEFDFPNIDLALINLLEK